MLSKITTLAESEPKRPCTARWIGRRVKPFLVLGFLLGWGAATFSSHAEEAAFLTKISAAADAQMPGIIELRHWFHEHPELGNREFNTAQRVKDELTALGFDEVREGVAHTGVVGILRGGLPGKRVALRADMDGLPVTEKTGLPFASKVTTTWNDQPAGVMHACGHDAHMAILIGVARVLASMRAEIPGEVMFIFQPAEEGAPPGEEGGAELMLKEGLFAAGAKPGAVFGLHVFPGETGSIMYRPNGFMAAADYLEIDVQGVQTHGSMPWAGIDPITASAQVITSLQTVVSRQLDITTAPAVVTIGTIDGGNRNNIIPEKVSMTGTIRTLDPGMRNKVHELIRNTATHAAATMNAKADVMIDLGYPVTFNDPQLTREMAPVLDWASDGRANVVNPILGAEDFSYFAYETPGLFFGLGVLPDEGDDRTIGANHSPYFFVNDRALPSGVRALSALAMTWLLSAEGASAQK